MVFTSGSPPLTPQPSLINFAVSFCTALGFDRENRPPCPREGSLAHAILLVLEGGYLIQVQPVEGCMPQHDVSAALFKLRALGWALD